MEPGPRAVSTTRSDYYAPPLMELQLNAVLEANETYRRGAFAEAPRAAPPERHLVILTCMDARIDPLKVFGLALGDAHVLRNAGGRASDDAIRSLVASTHLLGTREIGIVHHTRCGMAGATQEEIAARTGVDDVDFLTFTDTTTSVAEDVERVRACGKLAEGVVVWGGVYDVDDGSLRILVEPKPVS